MTSLVAISSMIQIPNGVGGNINLGDAAIFAITYTLGYWSLLPAILGSGLVDLLSSYTLYIPATVIIKGIMALICAYLLKNKRKFHQKLITSIIMEIIMISGYYLYEYILMGIEVATIGLLFNTIQGLVSIIMGMLFYSILEKITVKNNIL